jgi:N-acetylglucosamine-6-phosphate deacetylase
MNKCIALKAKRLVTPGSVVQDAVIVIKDGIIDGVGRQSTVPVPENAEVVDYGDHILAPGMMDIHCHGYIKGQAGESPELALGMAELLLSGGTTSFLPTVSRPEAVANIATARRIQKQQGLRGAEMVGIHLEGPFLEPKKVEGVNTGDDNAPKPDLGILEAILKAGEGAIKIMGLGILLPNAEAVVRRLREEGIVVAVAHTKASAQDFARAIEMGYHHATHLFNVMTGLHHRRPGVVGGFLTHDGTTCELICDTLHVHSWAMDVAIRCKGVDRIAMITDLTMAGCEDGEYERGVFGDIPIVIKDGVARIKGSNELQDNTMAGSTMMQNVGVKNVLKLGYSWPEAFRMASLTPARIAGCIKTKGSLEITKDADVIVVDENVNVKATYVRGNLLYRA